VKNERRWSVDNQPYGTWWERLPALCFPAEHPFHHSLIGSMEDLSAASLEDVAGFFRTYYTPDNAVLTVAGDFDPAAVREMIERHFGAIARGGAKPPLDVMELPPSFGEWRRDVVADDVAAPRLLLACRIPPAGVEGWYAASLLGVVLGTGDGSVLARSLVREQAIATTATAFTFDLTKGSDLLVLDVTGRPGVPGPELESAVAAVMDGVISRGVDDEARSRAIALLETSWTVALQSAASRADKLSQYATYFGSASRVNEEIARHGAVTAPALSVAAATILREENRASLLFVPKDAGAAS